MENDIKIMPEAFVCEESSLRGDITISTGCIVHPSATIIAESGPIVIGKNCIIEEYATIIHRVPKTHPSYDPHKTPVLIIGANNHFEVGCRVEALKVGERNVFESKSYVSPFVEITNFCIIGAGCRVEGERKLAENSVIYGKNCFEREAIDKHAPLKPQIACLRKILPNFHHLRKVTFDPKKLREQGLEQQS
uniref:Dynactin subunit 6 n=1 Tax=Tabanus bromius TaxID=304241 RepID=A0A0K8TTC7_TABBR